MNERDID